MEKVIKICGLGVYPPQETTLETLQILGDCRVVFSDVQDEKAFKWLSGYCKELKRAAGAAAVMAAASRGGAVGVAVWGHPQFSSRLAREVELKCRKAKVPYEVSGAISPIGSVFARSVSFLGGDYGYQGIQAYDLETLLSDEKSLSPALPLVVYAEAAPPAAWRRLFGLLKSRYPAGHEIRSYAAGAPDERVLTVGRLKDSAPEFCALLVPPVAAGKPR